MRLKNKEIAETLGLSTTAVSLALNNRPGVSEATRRRVLELVNDFTQEAMQALNEQALNDESAQANRSVLLNVHRKNSRIINDKPFFSDIIEAAQQELLRQGYSMILSHYVPEQSLTQYIQYIQGLPIAGVILMATELDEADLSYYKQLGLPMVLMDGSFDLEELDSVTLDNQISIYRAMRYAVEMGHRSIGYLKGETFINNFGHRMDGYQKALRDFHLEGSPHPVVTLPCDIQGAYQEMSAFLDHRPNDFVMPTLFVSELDYIALGAMKALQEHGCRVPEDVSVIGYDDVTASAISTPPLTTIRVNHSDIGRIAARVLVDRIINPTECHITAQVSSSFIIRESVKRLS